METGPTIERGAAGRKLDHSRDAGILDATIAVLAELGYEGTTIDLVAERAGAARATVYRRWPTKAALVVAAVARMSETDAGPDDLPDTGSLREDLVAMIQAVGDADQQVRIRVMSNLQALSSTEPEVVEAVAGAGAGPWIEVHRTLIQRAIDRGEFPAADVATLAEIVPIMCVSRVALQRLPITPEFSVALIDGVIIPALRGGSSG